MKNLQDNERNRCYEYCSGDCDYGNGNCRRCSVNYKRSKAAGRKVQDYVLIFKGAFRGTVLTAGYNRLAACPRRHF